jgi:hypothetical protein
VKKRTTRKRHVLRSEDFNPLREVLVETEIAGNHVSAEVYIPTGGDLHAISLFLGSYGYEDAHAAKVEIEKQAEYIIRDLDTLADVFESLREFFLDQASPLVSRTQEKIKKRPIVKPSGSDS